MLGQRLGFVLNIDELMYLNSGIDKKVPYGISYSALRHDNLDEIIVKVKEGLAFKGILDSDYDLKDKGFKIMTLLHRYKTANEILKINNIHIIENNEDDYIYIKKVDKENYEIGVIKKKTMLLSIGLNYPFLFNNGIKEKINISEEREFEIKNKIENKEINTLTLRRIGVNRNLSKEYNRYLNYYGLVIRHNLLNDTMEVVTKEDTDRDLFYILSLTFDI